MLVEVIRGASVTAALCILTTLGGRKNDSYLIAMAGVAFVLMALLDGVNSTTASIEASLIGQSWNKILGLIKWIF